MRWSRFTSGLCVVYRGCCGALRVVLDGAFRAPVDLRICSMEVLSNTPRELKLKLHEAGPIAIYCAYGVPKAKGINFSDAGNGIFKASMHVGKAGKSITIWRK